jgi:Xaa-Pro aminopeptidase
MVRTSRVMRSRPCVRATYTRTMRRIFLLLSFALAVRLTAQDVPLFTSDFPPAEFAARRAKIYDAIGKGGLAVLQGAASPGAYVRFRQNNDFYYLTGIEVPRAYVLLDGERREATLCLPHRNESREKGEGKTLSVEDADLVKKLSGIENVTSTEAFGEMLSRYAREGRVLFTPFQAAENMSMSRDLATRVIADAAADPWDGTPSREGRFLSLLRERFPQFELRNLSPTLDEARLIKSPREMALIRKATVAASEAILEAMRSTVPGLTEYELDAVAKYVFYRNGAQGDAYYSLIATGANAVMPHYSAGKGVLKDGDLLLFDYAPDVGYYMSDVTRMWPVNGTFNSWQRELYGFYLGAYRAILNHIRLGATAATIKEEAVADMDRLLAATKFSKPIYEAAAREFVESYRKSPPRLGHWVGMATHDVGKWDGPLRPGMVFTIEPALRVPEEQIYIRLEDVIFITEKGAEIVTDFLPMDVDAIENVMKAEGMLQKYPKMKAR